MNSYKFLLLLLLFLVHHLGYAQVERSNLIAGQRMQINSSVLKKKVQLQVYLPQDYQKSAKKYPVLYLLDGQRFYYYGIYLLKSFTQFELTPEFIIVGINTPYPQRFGWFSRHASKFSNFLEQEVIQFIDQQYRTSQERLLFGWEYGGGFAIEVLAQKPSLFNAYLAASPFPLTSRLKALQKQLAIPKKHHTCLYFSVGANESTVYQGVNQLRQLLAKKTAKNIAWHYQKLTSEVHRSTPHHVLYHGIKAYYKTFEDIKFEHLKAYEAAGGLDYVEKYYQQRGKQYGLAPQISYRGMWHLLRLAYDENNYSSFDFFMTHFQKNGFMEQVTAGWGFSYTQFYLRHKKASKAISLYQGLVKRFPQSAKMMNALGDAYWAAEKHSFAKKSYQKAVKLARKNGDKNVSQYEVNLARTKK